MSTLPTYNLKKLKPREIALAKDHIRLHKLCDRSELIEYEILRQSGNKPPDKYKIIYHVKSIIDTDEDRMPIYGDRHEVSIELPPQYPASDGGNPLCYALTPIWHPNMRWAGDNKGYICTDMPSLGAWHKLDDLTQRIGEIIKYKNYLAENIPPYPEDQAVAEWVREFAEPRGIVGKNKPIDTRELLKPLEGFQERKKLINIISKPATPTPKPLPFAGSEDTESTKDGDSGVYTSPEGITIKITLK